MSFLSDIVKEVGVREGGNVSSQLLTKSLTDLRSHVLQETTT